VRPAGARGKTLVFVESGFLALADEIHDEVRDAYGDWTHADPLESRREGEP